MSIQCCVERPHSEEQETPDKEAEEGTVKLMPWYGKPPLMPPPPRVVTTLPRTISNATTVPN